MSNLNGAIAEHATQGDNPDGTYNVTRTPARTYDVNGRLQAAGPPTTIKIVASVQTASGDDLVDVPEGQSTEGAKLILTETELRVRTPTTEPDIITIKGKPYRITSVDEVEHWGETHYECVATRLDDL